MNDRLFSDSVQYQAVLSNLEQNDGQLKCALCGKKLTSKAECRFDHIVAYAKGGKSTLENCQILCVSCNLSKSDKEMNDYLLEEKAKRFMAGETINEDNAVLTSDIVSNNKGVSKEEFDKLVKDFIDRNGNIKKIDFSRDRNGLPSIAYVNKYYGTITELKKAFGLKVDIKWDRDNIWNRLVEYAEENPYFRQKDLVKSNGLPSLPCILSNYPEYKSFSDIKTALGLELNYELWTKERVIETSKKYLETHSKITLKDLRKENGLPTAGVIYSNFGTMENYQKEIGSEVSKRQKYISEEELIAATNAVIRQYGSVFESRRAFLEVFPYSQSVIIYRYGSFEKFVNLAKIKILHAKKAIYTKQEVDEKILSYLKKGNAVPTSPKHLTELDLPSSATILRFYETWKEPFVIFSKMISITS